MNENQTLTKIYGTNQEKIQYRSVFELKICKEIMEYYQFFVLFNWSF